MVIRRGEMMVIFPWTRSSKMKFFFVCSLMNLIRTGRSTSVKSMEMYTGVFGDGAGGAGAGGGGATAWLSVAGAGAWAGGGAAWWSVAGAGASAGGRGDGGA